MLDLAKEMINAGIDCHADHHNSAAAASVPCRGNEERASQVAKAIGGEQKPESLARQSQHVTRNRRRQREIADAEHQRNDIDGDQSTNFRRAPDVAIAVDQSLHRALLGDACR